MVLDHTLHLRQEVDGKLGFNSKLLPDVAVHCSMCRLHHNHMRSVPYDIE